MSAEFDRFRLFVDNNRVHIHERSDDGEMRCVTQLDAGMAEIWAVRLWEAKKEIGGEA